MRSIQRMSFRTSRGSRQGLPRPSSLRGGFGMRDSNTSHCLSVRSMLCFSSWKDIWQDHYSLTSTFMRWLLVIDRHVCRSFRPPLLALTDLGRAQGKSSKAHICKDRISSCIGFNLPFQCALTSGADCSIQGVAIGKHIGSYGPLHLISPRTLAYEKHEPL